MHWGRFIWMADVHTTLFIQLSSPFRICLDQPISWLAHRIAHRLAQFVAQMWKVGALAPLPIRSPLTLFAA